MSTQGRRFTGCIGAALLWAIIAQSIGVSLVEGMSFKQFRASGMAAYSRVHNISSLLECASLCLADVNCTGFSFNASASECDLADLSVYFVSEAGAKVIYVVESAIQQSSSDYVCPANYTQGIGNDVVSCYKMGAVSLGYTAADASCRSDGAYLVMIKNKDQYKSLVGLISQFAVSSWIGLSSPANIQQCKVNNGVVPAGYMDCTARNLVWTDGTRLADDSFFSQIFLTYRGNCCLIQQPKGNVLDSATCGNTSVYFCQVNATLVTTTNSPGTGTAPESTATY